jgi:predicted HicB family RNase H-like nuclease
MNLLSYKDYLGSVEFDQNERLFYGRLAFIRALVSYEAMDAEGLVRAFHEAVDDYLAHCTEEGTSPERPLKGSFNVRTGLDLHRPAVVASRAHPSSAGSYSWPVTKRTASPSERTAFIMHRAKSA